MLFIGSRQSTIGSIQSEDCLLKNAKYNEISHYQAINIELSTDGYRGDLMIRQWRVNSDTFKKLPEMHNDLMLFFEVKINFYFSNSNFST